MQSPDRVTVPTCIGCGAMERYGTCETSCSEHKLVLVSAADLDVLEADRLAVRARIGAFRPVVEELARTEPGSDGWQAAYQATQRAAVAILSGDRALDDSHEPAGRVTTWWCAECGGIDAPQPCLGICVWRPADWVNQTVYEEKRSGAAAERDAARGLVRLLRRVASVTPRGDQWERNWRLIQSEAREALRACSGEAGRVSVSV